jgi:hypothetical protein
MNPSFRNLRSVLVLSAALAAMCGCQSVRNALPFSDDEPERKPLPPAMVNRLDRLLHQVTYSKGSTLLGQLRELSAFGAYATQPVIDRLLASEDAKLRAGAVYVLGEIDRLDGDTRAREAVHGALSDPDNSVRLEAARALMETGDKRGAGLLVDALCDADRGVRIRAFLALSQAAGNRYAYDPDAPDAERRAAMERFRGYFESAGAADIGLPTASEFEPAPIAPAPTSAGVVTEG